MAGNEAGAKTRGDTCTPNDPDRIRRESTKQAAVNARGKTGRAADTSDQAKRSRGKASGSCDQGNGRRSDIAPIDDAKATTASPPLHPANISWCESNSQTSQDQNGANQSSGTGRGHLAMRSSKTWAKHKENCVSHVMMLVAQKQQQEMGMDNPMLAPEHKVVHLLGR